MYLIYSQKNIIQKSGLSWAYYDRLLNHASFPRYAKQGRVLSDIRPGIQLIVPIERQSDFERYLQNVKTQLPFERRPKTFKHRV